MIIASYVNEPFAVMITSFQLCNEIQAVFPYVTTVKLPSAGGGIGDIQSSSPGTTQKATVHSTQSARDNLGSSITNWIRGPTCNLESLKAKSTGPVTTYNPDSSRPLLKSSTYNAMYHPQPRHGRQLVPICITTYNLDWDELLPILREAYPNREFPDYVS